jgi:hypothetical protein
MKEKVILSTFVSALCLNAGRGRQTSDNPVLGTGKGVDHLGIAVKNMEQSQHDYQDILGFNARVGGQHSGGRINSIARFRDGTYLELIAVTQPHQNSGLPEKVASFAEKHEGGMYLGIDVSKGGDIGYCQGIYSLTTTDAKTKKPVVEKGKYVTVFKKHGDGSWKAIEG